MYQLHVIIKFTLDNNIIRYSCTTNSWIHAWMYTDYI